MNGYEQFEPLALYNFRYENLLFMVLLVYF